MQASAGRPALDTEPLSFEPSLCRCRSPAESWVPRIGPVRPLRGPVGPSWRRGAVLPGALGIQARGATATPQRHSQAGRTVASAWPHLLAVTGARATRQRLPRLAVRASARSSRNHRSARGAWSTHHHAPRMCRVPFFGHCGRPSWAQVQRRLLTVRPPARRRRAGFAHGRARAAAPSAPRTAPQPQRRLPPAPGHTLPAALCRSPRKDRAQRRPAA